MVSWFASGTASAQSLPEALKAAYYNNPTLRADRERQKATDEQVPQALSGWRPTVEVTGSGGQQWARLDAGSGFNPVSKRESTPAIGTITLSQPIFSGFQTVSGTKQAEANVQAGRQQLLSVEQQVLLDASTAYMDVLRDRQIVVLRQRNLAAFQELLRATDARFNVGEVTRTDVAQSQARLSLARAALSVSRSNLERSNANFEQVIGRAPGKLTYPPLSRRVPKSLQDALAVARRTNPQILAAAFNAEAAQHNIDVQKGNLLPQVALEVSYTHQHDSNSGLRDADVGSVLGTVSIPLYQAGQVYSQIREAKHLANQNRILILEADRAVRYAVASTWAAYVASADTIRSLQSQVDANRIALDGVKQEALVGTRTTLDVLNAESDLVLSEVDLVQAQRNQIVAAYQVIASIGRMTADSLGLAVDVYDPTVNYEQVRDQWFGASVKPVE